MAKADPLESERARVLLSNRLTVLDDMRSKTYEEIQRIVEEIADRVRILHLINSKDFRESLERDVRRYRDELEATQKTLGALENEYNTKLSILMSIPIQTLKV